MIELAPVSSPGGLRGRATVAPAGGPAGEVEADSVPGSGTIEETVLLAGFEASLVPVISEGLHDSTTVLEARDLDRALEILAEEEIAVLCLGPAIGGERARRLLRRAVERSLLEGVQSVVLAAGREPGLFDELIADDLIFYLTPQPPKPEETQRILLGALAANLGSGEGPIRDPGLVLGLTEPLRRVASLEQAAALLSEATEAATEASRAFCLVYDVAAEVLWTPEQPGDSRREESAVAGLVSYVLRTATPVTLDALADDPRYDPEADNDRGPRDERFLGVPVLAPADGDRGTSSAHVLAVLVALRPAELSPFGEGELSTLRFLASQAAPILQRLVLLDLTEKRQLAFLTGGDERIFRREAIEHHTRGHGDRGRPLEISPAWTRWTLRLLLPMFAAALAGLWFGKLHEYAEGMAVVQIGDRGDVTATAGGTVTAVHVASGQRVAAGPLLVSLYGTGEAAELERLHRELEHALVERLRDPSDPSTGRALGALVEQRRSAESRLEERSIRAPRDGVVDDLRARLGQLVTPGQVVLTLRPDRGADQPGGWAVAVLPGHSRPLIRTGMPLRLELRGHRYAYQQLVIQEIADGVVGPAEAQRILGAGIGDAVPLSGPVVFVRARLISDSFTSGGRSYRYHDGMIGRVEVRVRSERILTSLFPGLRKVLGQDG